MAGLRGSVKKTVVPAPGADSTQTVSTVTLDDAAYAGQSDSRAFEAVTRMQLLERLEELARMGHVEADAVIRHIKELVFSMGAPAPPE